MANDKQFLIRKELINGYYIQSSLMHRDWQGSDDRAGHRQAVTVDLLTEPTFLDRIVSRFQGASKMFNRIQLALVQTVSNITSI